MVHRNQWSLNILSFIVSLEDAHRHNDLLLFDKFKKTTIILGVVTIANSRVETVDEIKERVTSVLRHIPAERLVLAPDCGLWLFAKRHFETKTSKYGRSSKEFLKVITNTFHDRLFVITNTEHSFKNNLHYSVPKIYVISVVCRHNL